MRRTSGLSMDEAVPFYEQALGLPRMRVYGNHLVLLWAGEDLVFEIKTDDHPTRPQADPGAATCIPVFRSHDLDATRGRLQAFGHEPVAERHSAWGRTLFYRSADRLVTGIEWRSPTSPLRRYVVDPEGHLTGIEERGLIRDYLEDVEADRRWRPRPPSPE